MPIPQVPSPLFSVQFAKTYNAAWFKRTGDSNAQAVQRAIDAGVADNIVTAGTCERIFVPSNLLPYNASLVTFDNSIKMVREGGDWSVFDVRAYGADSTGDAGIAWNAARAGVGGGAVIYVGPGVYTLTTPFTFGGASNVILLIDTNVVLFGAALPAAGGSNQIIDYRLGNLIISNTAVTLNTDLQANGGFRQTIDGWIQDNIAASQTNVELTRAVGRFRAARSGSVTAVIATLTEARTAGTLTVDVFKNTGLAGVTGASIGLTAVIDATNTSRKATIQAKDTDTFVAGDELYAVVTTDGAWAPITSDLRVAIEIED